MLIQFITGFQSLGIKTTACRFIKIIKKRLKKMPEHNSGIFNNGHKAV